MLTGFMIPDHALRMFGGSCRSLFFQCREKVWRTRKKKKVYRPVFRALSGWYWVIHQDNISRSKRRLCSLLFPPPSFTFIFDLSLSFTKVTPLTPTPGDLQWVKDWRILVSGAWVIICSRSVILLHFLVNQNTLIVSFNYVWQTFCTDLIFIVPATAIIKSNEFYFDVDWLL